MTRLTIALVALGISTLTAGGFYLRKKYLESEYKSDVIEKQGSFNDCIQKAEGNDAIQRCWNDLQKVNK